MLIAAKFSKHITCLTIIQESLIVRSDAGEVIARRRVLYVLHEFGVGFYHFVELEGYACMSIESFNIAVESNENEFRTYLYGRR